jgi:hypothetical protein
MALAQAGAIFLFTLAHSRTILNPLIRKGKVLMRKFWFGIGTEKSEDARVVILECCCAMHGLQQLEKILKDRSPDAVIYIYLLDDDAPVDGLTGRLLTEADLSASPMSVGMAVDPGTGATIH